MSSLEHESNWKLFLPLNGSFAWAYYTFERLTARAGAERGNTARCDGLEVDAASYIPVVERGLTADQSQSEKSGTMYMHLTI